MSGEPMVITAATPMTMPSIVRKLRSRLRRISRNDSSRVFHHMSVHLFG